MNGQDILDALSGIDPKYIEEAADTQNNVVDITSAKRRRSIRKTLYVVLPSVAAILLIVAVALPAVLRVSKSESATMAEAPAAAAEDAAAPAAEETAGEATAEEAVAEAAPAAEETEAADEAPMAESAKTAGPTDNASEYLADDNNVQTLAPNIRNDADTKDAEEPTAQYPPSEEAEAPAVEMWEIKEASYDSGILILRCSRDITEDITKEDYLLTRLDVPAKQSKVSGGLLSSLSDHIDVTDNYIVIDLMENKLAAGDYRIRIGDVYADFTVK